MQKRQVNLETLWKGFDSHSSAAIRILGEQQPAIFHLVMRSGVTALGIDSFALLLRQKAHLPAADPINCGLCSRIKTSCDLKKTMLIWWVPDKMKRGVLGRIHCLLEAAEGHLRRKPYLRSYAGQIGLWLSLGEDCLDSSLMWAASCPGQRVLTAQNIWPLREQIAFPHGVYFGLLPWLPSVVDRSLLVTCACNGNRMRPEHWDSAEEDRRKYLNGIYHSKNREVQGML